MMQPVTVDAYYRRVDTSHRLNGLTKNSALTRQTHQPIAKSQEIVEIPVKRAY